MKSGCRRYPARSEPEKTDAFIFDNPQGPLHSCEKAIDTLLIDAFGFFEDPRIDPDPVCQPAKCADVTRQTGAAEPSPAFRN